MAKNKYGGVCNVDNPDKRVYTLWYSMLRRCYDEKSQSRSRGKSYAGCTVCDSWLDYSNFARDITLLFGYEDWLNGKGYCLDKDTINPNNNVYCKEFCCFIPYQENIGDIHRRNPQNIERLHELRKTKYMLVKDDEVLLFNSEKEACEYMGVVKCSISSCYRRGRKCKGYRIAKMDGKGEGE
jgi:hypothetical protein